MVEHNLIGRLCEWCSDNFLIPRHRLNDKNINRGRFCSKRCYSKWIKGKIRKTKMKRIIRECGYCKKEMKVIEEGSYQRKYCSYKCSYSARRNRIKKKCAYCKIGYEVVNCRSNSLFCSLKCRNMNKRRRIKYQCANCSKWCELTISHYNRKNTHVCSLKCKQEYFILDKSPNWRGGLSFEPYGKEFNNKLKKAVKDANNYTCQICRKNVEESKIKLDVHHIDYNKKNNNPSNLIPLCVSCHGKTGTNRLTWIEYFENKLSAQVV